MVSRIDIPSAHGSAPPARALKRSLGLGMATALVVGNMVGSGIFSLPAVLAGEAGPASIVALALTGIGALLLALVFANLGRAHPRTGGPYYYARRAFGDFVGFQTAWAYWIAAWVGNAAIAVAFAGYVGVFWGTARTTNWVAALVAVGAVWLFTLVNIVGARETGVAQVLTTVLKFVPLAVIGIVGLFYVKGGNFTPFTIHGGFDWHIGAAATLALWAFIGLESATVPAEEVVRPEQNVPRATILGTLATTLLYVVALVAIVGILPHATLAGSSAPFADAANAMWAGTFLGLTWGKWVALVAIAATLGALNGWIMLTARTSLAAAEDGLFPGVLARVHGRRGTPIVGIVVSSVLCSGLVLVNGWNQSFSQRFTDIVLLATWMTLIAYAYAAAAEVVLFIRERELFSWAKLARDTVIASLAFAYSVWAIWGAGEAWLAKGFMLLLFGIPVYVWMKWRQRPAPVAAPATNGASRLRVKVSTSKPPVLTGAERS